MNTKKILALLLAAVMAVSFAVSAFAASGEGYFGSDPAPDNVIPDVYDDDESTKFRLFTPTDYLNQFLSEGNIRIMAESSSADFNSNNEPTTEQYNLLRDY